VRKEVVGKDFDVDDSDSMAGHASSIHLQVLSPHPDDDTNDMTNKASALQKGEDAREEGGFTHDELNELQHGTTPGSLSVQVVDAYRLS
jgi:hypothetical protein